MLYLLKRRCLSFIEDLLQFSILNLSIGNVLLRGTRKDCLEMPKCLTEMLTTNERHFALTWAYFLQFSIGVEGSKPHRKCQGSSDKGCSANCFWWGRKFRTPQKFLTLPDKGFSARCFYLCWKFRPCVRSSNNHINSKVMTVFRAMVYIPHSPLSSVMADSNEQNTHSSFQNLSPIPPRVNPYLIWARAWVWARSSVGLSFWLVSAAKFISTALEPSPFVDSCLLLLKLASRRLGVTRGAPSRVWAPRKVCISPSFVDFASK